MDYTDKRVKIVNLNRWEMDSFSQYKELNSYIGKSGVVKNDSNAGSNDDCYRLEIYYDNENMNILDKSNGGLCLRIENVELLDNTHTHVKQPKPPLGVMPKQIFEWHRVIDLCRALHEYSLYEDVDRHLMIKWSDELNDRLYGLKSMQNNKSTENNYDDDES